MTFEQLMTNVGADNETPMMTPEETDMILASDKEIKRKYNMCLLGMIFDPHFHRILANMAADGLSSKEVLYIVRCSILDFILENK